MNIVITLYYDQRSSLTLACPKDELDELELDAIIGAFYKAVGGGWLYVVDKTGDMLQFLAFIMTMIPGKIGGQHHPPTECWS